MTSGSSRSRFGAHIFSLVCFPLACAAAPQPDLLDRLSAAVRQASSSDATRATADALYDKAILEDGNIDRQTRALKKLAADPASPKRQRALAFLLSSDLYWRHGQIDLALDAANQALVVDDTAGALLQKARLLDASGQASSARALFETALRRLTDPDEILSVRLRLAVMRMSTGDTKHLVELAKERDQAFRNRAATALALLNHYSEAVELFRPASASAHSRFAEEVRLAEWALKTQGADFAIRQAWRAVNAAVLADDRLYALSVLVEAYRSHDRLQDLIERFAGEKAVSSEARRIWVDLLRDAGQYDQALTALAADQSADSNLEAKRLLIRIKEEAGDEKAVSAEYRKFIAEQPHATIWYEGLSEFLLTVGKADLAEQVWRDFLRANMKDTAVLLDGAEAMARMGFDALAIAGIEEHAEQNSNIVPLLFFEFDLFVKKGRVSEAESTLERLDGALGSLAEERVNLADGYERLNLPHKALAVWEKLANNAGRLGYDEEVRIASLYEALDKNEQALQLWQALWRRVTLPARRNFVEDRMMQAAAELGRLGDIAVDLEAKLAKGEASKIDSSLLVRIYVKAADKISAAEVVAEYFGATPGTEVEVLAEQANIYLLLRDYTSYNATLEQLVKLDPDNGPAYLRRLIFSEVERHKSYGLDAPAIAKVRKLLSRLRALDKEAAGGEFEASVLMLAGLDTEAIEAYRRATAQGADRGAAYLLLGDLLKKHGHAEQAAAIFQYLAEDEESDDQFTAAMDGVVSAAAAQQSDGTRSPILQWAERAILQRLIARKDEVYLFQALADVADERGDVAQRVAVLENMLSLENVNRAATLRQLIGLTSPNERSDDAHQNDTTGIIAHLRYGRRLVALNEEFPPAVYISLGEVFLQLKDPASAAKAFDLAEDVTGRKNVRELAAQQFARAGYDRQAVEHYARALISDSDNVAVMLRLARLRERLGQRDAANDLYTEALRALLLKQPALSRSAENRDPPPPVMPALGGPRVYSDPNVTREFQDTYRSLLVGLFATWPEDASRSEAKLEMFQELTLKELRRVVVRRQDQPVGKLQTHARLYRMSELFRRVAFSVGAYGYAERLDSELLKHFRDDDEFFASAHRERLAWGLDTSAPAAANADGSFERTLSISLVNGDQAQMLAAARDWARSGSHLQAVSWAKGRLDFKNYRNLCQYVAQLVRNDEKLRESVFEDSRTLFDIEAATGQPLFAEPALIRKFKTFYGAQGFFAGIVYVGRRLPAEDVVALMEYVASASAVSRNLQPIAQLWSELIKKPLTADLAKKTARLVQDALARLNTDAGTNPLENLGGLVTSVGAGDVRAEVAGSFFLSQELVAGNVELARQVYEFWRGKSAREIDYYTPLLLLREGKTAAAIAAYVSAVVEVKRNIQGHRLEDEALRSFRNLFLPKYQEELAAALDAVATREGQSGAVLDARLDLFLAEDGADQEKRLSFLEKAGSLYPKNEKFLIHLYRAYDRQGLPVHARDVLADLLNIDPASMVYRAALFEQFKRLDMPVEALGLNDASAEDMRPRAFLTALYDREQSRTPLEEMVGILSAYVGTAASGGSASVSTEPALSSSLGGRPLDVLRPPTVELRYAGDPGDELASKIAQAVATKDFEGAKRSLRTLWYLGTDLPADGSPVFAPVDAAKILDTPWPIPAGGNAENPSVRDDPFEVLDEYASVGSAHKLFDEIVKYRFSVEELEDYWRTLSAADVGALAKLAPYLAKAYRTHGLADRKVSELTDALRSDRANFRDFTLWLALLGDEPGDLPSWVVALLDKRSVQLPYLSRYQVRKVAQLYARLGKAEQASQTYRYLAARMFPVALSGGPVAFGGGANPQPEREAPLTVWEFVDEATRNLSGSDLARVIEAILRTNTPGSDSSGAVFDKYAHVVMLAWERALGAAAALERSYAVTGDPNAEWSVGNLVEIANLRARAGQLKQASAALKMAVTNHSDAESGATAARLGLSPDLAAAAQFGLPAGYLESRDVAALSRRLFPSPRDAWPGSREWLRSAGADLTAWTRVGEVGWDAAVRLMLVVAYRMHQAGDDEPAKALLTEVAGALPIKGRLSGKTTALALTVADELGRPFDLAAMTALLNDGRLDAKQAWAVIERTAAAQGAAAAIALGEVAVAQSRNDALLGGLIALARTAGKDTHEGRWRTMRAQASEARRKLEPAENNVR